ncbi:MAG: metallophosphoesterase, partial [Calditrichaeota bacterium]
MNYRKIALIGGVYSNYLALQATLQDAQQRGVEAIFCLGDLGAFGPYPNRTCDILREHQIPVVQGNYD